MVLVPVNNKNAGTFINLVTDMYNSPAVLKPVPQAVVHAIAKEVLRGGPYLKGFLIEEEGIPAGYLLLGFSFSPEAGGPAVQIEEIYVRDEHRGRGIGSKVLEWCFKEYKDAARFRLEVEPKNAGALSLYDRLGFEVLPYVQMVKDKNPH